jgi:copper chaperone CopZ
MATKIIRTQGLRCGSCDKRIELELEDIEGVIAVTSNHETGIVEVEYDEAICNTACFQSAIEELDPDFKVVG